MLLALVAVADTFPGVDGIDAACAEPGMPTHPSTATSSATSTARPPASRRPTTGPAPGATAARRPPQTISTSPATPAPPRSSRRVRDLSVDHPCWPSHQLSRTRPAAPDNAVDNAPDGLAVGDEAGFPPDGVDGRPAPATDGRALGRLPDQQATASTRSRTTRAPKSPPPAPVLAFHGPLLCKSTAKPSSPSCVTEVDITRRSPAADADEDSLNAGRPGGAGCQSVGSRTSTGSWRVVRFW